MTAVSLGMVTVIDFVLGSLATAGLLYLLYSNVMVVHYRRFFGIMTVGLLIYAVTGPVFGLLAPSMIHTIHGIAVLFISIGLFDLLREDLDSEFDPAVLLFTEAGTVDDIEFTERS